MKDNMDCSVVADLLPLSLEGLAGEESEKLIQTHLQTCKKCQRHKEELILEKQVEEVGEQENDKRILKALKRWRYEMIGLLIGVFAVFGMILVLLFAPFFLGNGDEEVYAVREHYEQVTDYGKQDYRGISGLAMFPQSDNMKGNIEEFYYDSKGGNIYQQYQIYLKCTYDKETYKAEKKRLLDLKDEYTGRQSVYSEDETFLPCVYAMLYDEGYEYALLSDEECMIIYIYLQGIDRREIAFRMEYLPKDYGQAGYDFETERESYRIYQTEMEKIYYE